MMMIMIMCASTVLEVPPPLLATIIGFKFICMLIVLYYQMHNKYL